MIEVKINVNRKVYVEPATVALENVAVTTKAGEFVSFVGPSGAGKSTLLSIVAGLDNDYEGSVELSKKGGRSTPDRICFPRASFNVLVDGAGQRPTCVARCCEC